MNAWIVKLSTVSEMIEQWLMVQNMWMYMEAVFSGGDIVKQLPAEAKRFQNIDKNYMKVIFLSVPAHSSFFQCIVGTISDIGPYNTDLGLGFADCDQCNRDIERGYHLLWQ